MKDTLEIKFAKGITSLAAVMVPMILNIIGLAIAGAHLLYTNFPQEGMPEAAKLPSAVLIGAVLATALISVAANKKILKPWHDKHKWIGFPLLLAVFSFVLLLFFFQVFELWAERPVHESMRKIFLGGLIAFLEYIFAYVFVEKKAETQADIKFETKIAKLQATKKQLETTISKLEETNKQLKPTKEKLKSLEQEHAKLVLDLTCRKCGKMKNARSLASHESTCQGTKHLEN